MYFAAALYGIQYRMICTICSCLTVITVLLQLNVVSLFLWHLAGHLTLIQLDLNLDRNLRNLQM